MGRDDGMRVVGTIRSIELHTTPAKFQNVSSRQVARIRLDIERATDEAGEELDVMNLVDPTSRARPSWSRGSPRAIACRS